MFSNKVSILIFTYFLIVSIRASSNCCAKELKYGFMKTATFSNCEGKDSGNYTMITLFSRDASCSRESVKPTAPPQLISCSASSRESNVNTLEILARSNTPNGAHINPDVLSLVVSGPLEGKYTYYREVVVHSQYLKICSSVLGYSYVNSKTSTLLIADKLDMNVLISPTGAYELFKKGCTTQCSGTSIIVGPTQIITN